MKGCLINEQEKKQTTTVSKRNSILSVFRMNKTSFTDIRMNKLPT